MILSGLTTVEISELTGRLQVELVPNIGLGKHTHPYIQTDNVKEAASVYLPN